MFNQLLPSLEITRREIRDQIRDWRIVFPILFLTLFFPFFMNFTAQQMMGFIKTYGVNIIGERMIPFLLMIVGFFPISVSLVMALESFVGEKERGTIEQLLNTPLKDWQLYIGKLLAAILPPLIASFLGMSVYLSGLAIKHVLLPPFSLIFQIFILTTVQAIMMVSGAVAISTHTTSVRAANLLACFIIVPAALLIEAESVVMFLGDTSTLWWVTFGLLVLTVLLMRVGLAHFQREELLGREIDVLNLRWMGRVFKDAFIGGARSPLDWYLRVMPQSVRGLALPMIMVTVFGALATWIGAQQIHKFQIPLLQTNTLEIHQRLLALVNTWPLFDYHPVVEIWWQNSRTMLLAMLLGGISFGILGMLPLILTLGIAGYLVNLVTSNGIPFWQYLGGFFLPHGIIEIPAAILATASVLKAGASLAAPVPDKTVGEVWLVSFAEFAKIMLGLVIPLLFIAASIEAWVTPRLAIWLFR
jgi:ABC-type transport system involved in multi-copper enzyme maturation permease subunit